MILYSQMYVCGSGRMATAVREKLVEIVQTQLQLEPAEAAEAFNTIIKGRFATDIFE